MNELEIIFGTRRRRRRVRHEGRGPDGATWTIDDGNLVRTVAGKEVLRVPTGSTVSRWR